MARHLIVVEPFDGHQRGARIEDAETVAAVLAGENAGHVVAVAALEAPARRKPKEEAEAAK
jgi:hypothetical protein